MIGSLQEIISWNHVCLQNHASHNVMPGQYYFNWNLHFLSVCSCLCEDSRILQLNLYSDISIAGDLYCSKAVDSNVRNGGNINYRRICCFVVGPMYPSKSLTMCSSDFIFRKHKLDSAFCGSGVLQLSKTGPLAVKNFPLLGLFLSVPLKIHTGLSEAQALKLRIRWSETSIFRNKKVGKNLISQAL